MPNFEAARQFFFANKPELTAELVVRFRGFTRVLLREHGPSYGIYFSNPGAPCPFLWLGMTWAPDAPPGVLPRWGVRMEIDGSHVEPFDRNVGGLLDAWRRVAATSEEIRLRRFDRRVELSTWRDFDWLLARPEHELALKRLWVGFVRSLAAGGVPAAVAAFTRQSGIG